jgi:hypothetical protein
MAALYISASQPYSVVTEVFLMQVIGLQVSQLVAGQSFTYQGEVYRIVAYDPFLNTGNWLIVLEDRDVGSQF